MNPYDSPIEAQAVPPPASPLLRTLLALASVFSGMLLFFFVAFLAPFAWLLRDGIGPDSTTSEGLQAFVRMFWCMYWGPATLFVMFVYCMALFMRYRLARSQS